MVGTAYLAGAVLCGLGYLYYGVLTARVKTTMQARRLLQASVIYLPLIYSLLILDNVSWAGSLLAKQYPESLLREVVVCGKRLNDISLPHDLHRNTVGQTVALIGAIPIELQAGKKRLPALRDDTDARVSENGLYGVGQKRASLGTGPSQIRGQLHQDLISSNKDRPGSRIAESNRLFIPPVSRIG